MKLLTTTMMILGFQIGLSQDCNYNFGRGTISYVLKTSTQTSEQKELTKKNIANMRKCLAKTTDPSEMYWLNNSIANKLALISPEDSLIEYYTLTAFQLDTVSFCKGYINIHNETQSEDSYFKSHFLDNCKDENLIYIRDYCKDNYLELSQEIIRQYEEKKSKESESKLINQTYIDALEKISKLDQTERKKNTVDWTIQGKLDSLNRLKLDELYKQYGFPSKELVKSEGVKNAFLVLHHSTDCEWNIKWTERFLEHYDEIGGGEIFLFYLNRNFNKKDGQCKDYIEYIEGLKKGQYSTIVNKAHGL